MARGAGTDGGPGGHNQVAGAPIQARAAQASWGRAQKLGSGRTPGWSPLSPFPWHGTPSGKALPPAQLGYLCGVCPHTGPGPPHTRTAPRGSGARGPSCRPPPGTRSGSRRSISLGTTPCVPALCTPLPRAAPPHTGRPSSQHPARPRGPQPPLTRATVLAGVGHGAGAVVGAGVLGVGAGAPIEAGAGGTGVQSRWRHAGGWVGVSARPVCPPLFPSLLASVGPATLKMPLLGSREGGPGRECRPPTAPLGTQGLWLCTWEPGSPTTPSGSTVPSLVTWDHHRQGCQHLQTGLACGRRAWPGHQGVSCSQQWTKQPCGPRGGVPWLMAPLPLSPGLPPPSAC